jgi:hypothetical protein
MRLLTNPSSLDDGGEHSQARLGGVGAKHVARLRDRKADAVTLSLRLVRASARRRQARQRMPNPHR